MDAVITILNKPTETSMPFNEFVIYRASHYPNQKQFLIVCSSDGDLPIIKIPESLTIIYAGKNLSKIRATVQSIAQDCIMNGDRFAIHLHQLESALLSQAALVGTGLRKKVLFTTHNTFSGYPFHNKVRSYINGLLAKYVSVVSNSAFEGYPKSLKLLKRGRILPIQNGVDTERIDKLLSKDTKKPGDKLVFVYVARMVPVKNHLFLLDVLKQVNDNVCIVFIGATDSEIVRRIETEGLSNKVVLTGLIPREQVFQRLQEAHFYISSSMLEGLPVSLLEGMYSGLPAIVSDIPQHREVSGGTGVISLLPLETKLWTEKIKSLAKMSPMEIESWGRESRAFVRDHFSLERMHREYDSVYEKVFQL